jgi:hypothetical protein
MAKRTGPSQLSWCFPGLQRQVATGACIEQAGLIPLGRMGRGVGVDSTCRAGSDSRLSGCLELPSPVDNV